MTDNHKSITLDASHNDTLINTNLPKSVTLRPITTTDIPFVHQLKLYFLYTAHNGALMDQSNKTHEEWLSYSYARNENTFVNIPHLEGVNVLTGKQQDTAVNKFSG